MVISVVTAVVKTMVMTIEALANGDECDSDSAVLLAIVLALVTTVSPAHSVIFFIRGRSD